ncbi:MAG: hypothetical protein AB1423_16770 [Pseudomonadota bacterium]
MPGEQVLGRYPQRRMQSDGQAEPAGTPVKARLSQDGESGRAVRPER